MASGTSKVYAKRQPTKSEGHDDVLDWENHLMVRFPPTVTPRVERLLEDDVGGEKLAVNFNQDMRHGMMQLGNQFMAFRVHDLPCVVEVQKTLDNKNLYKVADMSQMLVVSEKDKLEDPVQDKDVHDDPILSKSKREKTFQWPHGLAPPLKNVRKRRFRKTKKKKFMDAPDVERELKRLLRSDLEAHSVRWEVVSLEEEKKKAANAKAGVTEQVTSSAAAPTTSGIARENGPAAQRATVRDTSPASTLAPVVDVDEDTRDSLSNYFQPTSIFGELSSSSSENEEEDDPGSSQR